MQFYLRSIAVLAAFGLWTGGAAAQTDFNPAITTTRWVEVQVEDAGEPDCTNPNPPTEQLPNLVAADPSCNVFAQDAGSNFLDPSNDFYAQVSTSDGGTNWTLQIDDVVYGEVIQDGLGDAGATLTSMIQSFKLDFNTGGAVGPTDTVNNRYYQAVADFNGITLTLTGSPVPILMSETVRKDKGIWGQAVDPTDFPSNGIPLTLSCAGNPDDGANPLFSGTVAGAGVDTLTVVTSGGLGANTYQNNYVKFTSGPSDGVIQQILSHNPVVLTLRDTVTVAVSDTFEIIKPSVGSLGPPQPGLGSGELCDQSTLIAEPGYIDGAKGTTITALGAGTTVSVVGGASPAFTTFDWRIREIPTTNTDGDAEIDFFDNCSALAQPPDPTCDYDGDGVGNACDGDFNQSDNVDATDFGAEFIPAFTSGIDTGTGTDMNCSGGVPLTPGAVDATDFGSFFIPQFTLPGAPGPAGVGCTTPGECPPPALPLP